MPRLRHLIFLALFLTLPPELAADDWPQWLGPDRNGAAPALAQLVGALAVDFEPVWRRELGSGYSSLVISGDSVVTMATLEDGDYVISLDRASGRELWRYRLGETFAARTGSDEGPASTPTIADGAVFALEPSGRLVALELADGTLRWHKDLEADFGAEAHTFGYSTSPVWAGGLLIVAAGGGLSDSMIVALDPANGKVKWATGAETVRHQTPGVAVLGGIEQIVAPHNSGVLGLALADGKRLWSIELDESSEGGQVFALDDELILVSRLPGSSLLRIGSGQDPTSAELLWTSSSLGNSYAVPVRHGEYLYGFKRRFLSCVELATGETVWKSRQPGGQALTLAGDTLWIVSPEGDLVVAAATPDGYRELGRVNTFAARRVYTPPSVADDLVFVRNLKEAAAWRPRPTSPAVADRPSLGTGLIGTLLERLAGTDDREAVVERFEHEYSEWPILEGDRVHFLYRGTVEDIAIVGDMTGGYQEVPMLPIDGTDLYYRTFDAPEVFRWEYVFRVFDERQTDSRNSNSVESSGQARSAIARPRSLHGPAARPEEIDRAGLSTPVHVDFPVAEGEDPLAATLYLPRDHAETTGDYPLVLFLDGKGALEEGAVQRLLADRHQQAIVAFLELPQSFVWDDGRAALAAALTGTVLPSLVSDFRAAPSAAMRAIITQEWGVENVLHWALTGRQVGFVALQSPYFTENVIDRVFTPLLDGPAITLHIDWGESDDVNRDWGLDVAAQSEQLAATARRVGHTVSTATSPGGSNWTRWSMQVPAILDQFLTGVAPGDRDE